MIETIKNQRYIMTLPDERYRALKWAEQFLQDLLDPSITPRIPKAIRQRARSVLKHYPGEYYLAEIARQCPDIISKEMEPVTKLMKQYEQSKAEQNE